jgi:hypothetical protein
MYSKKANNINYQKEHRYKDMKNVEIEKIEQNIGKIQSIKISVSQHLFY